MPFELNRSTQFLASCYTYHEQKKQFHSEEVRPLLYRTLFNAEPFTTYILSWALHRGDHEIYATKRTIYLLNPGAKISIEETCIVVREERKVSGSWTC